MNQLPIIYAILLVAIPLDELFQGGCTQEPTVARAVDAHSQCSIHEISRESLVIEDGSELLVGPTAFAVAGSDILLVGNPTHVWKPDSSGKKSPLKDHGILGVVLPQSGPIRTVPAPIDAKRIAALRAIGIGSGIWGVAFAELEDTLNFGLDNRARALWYGIYDGRGWTTLEALPLPAEGRVRPFNASALLKVGDTLAWAMQISSPERMQSVDGDSVTVHWTDAVVFKKRNGRWSHEVVRTRRAAYVQLAHSDSLGFVLVVVRADRTLPKPSFDENSLFFYTYTDEWRVLRKVVPGGLEPVHLPKLSFTPENGVLSWKAHLSDGIEARAMIGSLEERNEPTVTLDPMITQMVPVLEGTTPLWVIEHLSPATEELELRFIVSDGVSAHVIGSMPSPFFGPFAALATNSSEILVAGALPKNPADPPVVTLIIRIEVKCE